MDVRTKICAFIMVMLSAQAGLIPFFSVTHVCHDVVFMTETSNASPFLPDDPTRSDEDSSGSVCLDLEEEMLEPHLFQITDPPDHPQPFIGINSLHSPLPGSFCGVLKPPQFV